MAILFSNEILNSIKKELKEATTSIQIITAYCKKSTFTYLNNCIGAGVKEKRLLVRFRMSDILSGSTDFSIIEQGKQLGWSVYIRFDLHAKTYIVDNKRGMIGSANVTNSGLSIGKYGNMEMATLVDIESDDISKINKLFDDSILVDDTLLEKLKTQINKINVDKKIENYKWDISVTSLFNPHIDVLFSYELPDKFNLTKGHYFSFLDTIYDGDVIKFKEIFRWSNAYLWLLNTLKENGGCLYFGALSQKLHKVLISDPRPYRRDVKQLLSNFLNLIKQLDMDEVIIDRPNYSQRVRLINATEKQY